MHFPLNYLVNQFFRHGHFLMVKMQVAKLSYSVFKMLKGNKGETASSSVCKELPSGVGGFRLWRRFWICAPVFTYSFQGFTPLSRSVLHRFLVAKTFQKLCKGRHLHSNTKTLALPQCQHCTDDVGAIVGTTSDSKKPVAHWLLCSEPHIHSDQRKTPGLAETVITSRPFSAAWWARKMAVVFVWCTGPLSQCLQRGVQWSGAEFATVCMETAPENYWQKPVIQTLIFSRHFSLKKKKLDYTFQEIPDGICCQHESLQGDLGLVAWGWGKSSGSV